MYVKSSVYTDSQRFVLNATPRMDCEPCDLEGVEFRVQAQGSRPAGRDLPGNGGGGGPPSVGHSTYREVIAALASQNTGAPMQTPNMHSLLLGSPQGTPNFVNPPTWG